MKIFKNRIGRPSKDILRKRRIYKISLIAFSIIFLITCIFIGIKLAKKTITAETRNISSPVTISITATNLETNKTISENGVSSWKNKDVWLSSWRNYSVKFNVKATSTSGHISNIIIVCNDAGYNTTKEAENSLKEHINSKNTNNKKNIDGSTGHINIGQDGIRYASIKAIDNRGNSKTIKVRVSIDKTAPKATLSWVNLKQLNGNYYTGSIGKVTCTDSLSGVNKAIAYEGLKTDNKKTGTNSATITLNQAGNNYFTGYCYDKAGNRSQLKNATKHKYVKTNPGIELALTANKEIGNKGTKYWSFYKSNPADWCAMFVFWATANTPVNGNASLCTSASGSNNCVYKKYINIKAARVSQYAEWIAKNKKFYHSEYNVINYGNYKNGNKAYVPQPGDLIFFANPSEYQGNPKKSAGQPYHVGIVKEVKNIKVYFIDGNGDTANYNTSKVAVHSYNLNHREIMGYGHWW